MFIAVSAMFVAMSVGVYCCVSNVCCCVGVYCCVSNVCCCVGGCLLLCQQCSLLCWWVFIAVSAMFVMLVGAYCCVSNVCYVGGCLLLCQQCLLCWWVLIAVSAMFVMLVGVYCCVSNVRWVFIAVSAMFVAMLVGVYCCVSNVCCYCCVSNVCCCVGGIYDYVDQILQLGKDQHVPIIFALSRRRLAYLLCKKQKIACVGVFYYDGAEVSVVNYNSTTVGG